ncbi:MAG: sigma-54 dependent transcriptional regulator [Bdellovibrionales bacterium]|nr:sigma-54 dependent transcriptional regulator [Bdellovibrionales bacterium]
MSSSGGRLLVVDDERNLTLVLEAMLSRAGFEVLVFNDPEKALETLETEPLDAVLTDLAMPGVDGLKIIDFCREYRPELPVILMTAFGTMDSAVSALRHGAADFISKPFDQEELLAAIRKAVASSREQAREPRIVEQKAGLSKISEGESLGALVGNSESMQEVLRLLTKVSTGDSTILLTGESGTGKELVARRIHLQSERSQGPFIRLNCAAIPKNLIESELFGHEQGAFTGAVTSKPGRFELADHGTLFLDEVAEIPMDVQAKLLRVLQEKTFERLGGVKLIRSNFRIIAATHRNLEAQVASGQFRDDLFYRLSVVPIHLPTLRERVSDIEPLVRYFLRQACIRVNRIVTSISEPALEVLKGYSWPGNIRQLENVIERMVVMCDGMTLDLQDLPEDIFKIRDTAIQESHRMSFKEKVRLQTQEVERRLIEEELQRNSGNVTRTAEALGLSRKGLQLKMKELGLRKSGDSEES